MWHFWLHPLRGLAALGVVFLHCYWTWTFFDATAVRKLYLFVDFFFVLSGFVISSGYARRIGSGAELRVFFAQRFRRLSFQYLLSGAVWLLAAWLTTDAAQRAALPGQVLRYVLFVDVYFESQPARINPVAWSVMAEFWVYGLFALVTLLLPSMRARLGLAVGVVIAGISVLASGWADLNLLYGPGALLRALTGFFLGSFCWLALYGLERRDWCHAGVAALTVGVVALVAAGYSADLLTLPVSAWVVVVFAGVAAPVSLQHAAQWRWLGDLSYPLYLWHFILSVVAAKVLGRFWGLGEAVVHHGEKFISVPAGIGLAGCLALVAVSVGWSALMIRAERGFWKRMKR